MTRNEVSVRRMLEALVIGILKSGLTRVIDGSYYEQISPFVESENTAIISPEELARRLCNSGCNRLLDFGCGTSGHRAMLEDFGYEWHGVNYRDGMAIDAAKEAAGNHQIKFYDGRCLPYPDAHFEIVYSFQTFEHIQNVPTTFKEICRVLRSGGSLIGTVSYLEQIHDYSTFNFTPYGFKLACQEAGLSLLKVYSRCDAFTFLTRRLLVATSGTDDNSLSSALHSENAISQAFVDFGERLGLSNTETNLLRLMFSTHFTFHAMRL